MRYAYKISLKKLAPVTSHCDFGSLVHQDLSWNDNGQRLSKKAMTALFQFKRNLT